MTRRWAVCLFVIVISVLSAPVIAGTPEADILSQVQQLNVTVPPTGTALLGSEESMTEHQSYLEESSFSIMSLVNSVLGIFGQNQMNWGTGAATPDKTGVASATPACPVSGVVNSNTLIPASPGLYTTKTITGGSGHQTITVPVYSDNWEVWYTADPYSPAGTNAANLPLLNIVITEAGSGKIVGTIEPPGGLDVSSWKQSDPRPWSSKFSEGDEKSFIFNITARDVRSYVIEIRERGST